MPPRLYPRLLLALLTGLNALNYIDRSVLFAVQPDIQKELGINDAQAGLLTSAFFFTYVIAAPLIGWIGDRVPRRHIVVAGIFVWSGFTVLTWFAHSYWQLLVRHAIVGIGEASYATIAPTLIADSFPMERRGRMLAVFNIGLPVGTAAGYLIGGYFGRHFGWRAPFMVAGLPGFLLALCLWFVPEPARGQSDRLEVEEKRSSIAGLWSNSAFLSATLGLAMYTFAVGGLQVWMPTFLLRVRGVPLARANAVFGLITLFNGIVATLLGGMLGDRMLRRRPGAYYTVSGVSMFIAVPLMVVSIYASGAIMFPAIFAAVFFLLLGTGPINAALVNSVSARIRSTALAINVFVIHLLGDAFSPSLMGRISDRTSLPAAFGTAFVAAALSGAILVYGARYAPRFRVAH